MKNLKQLSVQLAMTFQVVKNSKGDGGSYWGKLLGVSDTQRSVRQTVMTNIEECMTVKYLRNLPK